MSYIIDQTFNSCQKSNQIQSREIFTKEKAVQFIKKQLDQCLNKLSLQSFTETIQTHFTDVALFSKIIFKNLGLKFYDFLATIILNIQDRTVQIQVTAINSWFPYKIQSFHQRILACKLFSKNSSSNIFSKAIISIQNGSFKVVGPLFMSNSQKFVQMFKAKQKSLSILIFLKQSINYAMKLVKRLLIMCQNQLFSLKEEFPNQCITQKNHKLNKLLRYINRSTVMPGFDISLGSSKFSTVESKSDIQQQKIQTICKNICKDLQEFSSHKLYTEQLKKRQFYQKCDFTLTEVQIQKIKSKIAFPKQTKSIYQCQNKYIFNIVQFNEKTPVNFKKLASGGFGQIQIADIQYWHLITISGGKMKKVQEVSESPNQKKNLNKKTLAFKSNNVKGYESRDRLQHQFRIISRFKGAQSPFFCQYYKANNQKSQFNKFLIMEYIHYPTLGQYLKNNIQTISFMTKLHFSNLIAQAIRFLTFYDVVHLDIKPDNILIYKKLMIKLVDFGESYCSQFCNKTIHKPAFSMPYGSPEIFDGNQSQFSQKSDTYSLGVIMFQMIFKRLPFVFPRQKVLSIYKNRQYLSHLYYVPEQSPKYGQSQVMKIIQNLLLKCLNPDVQKRPHALWIALILKQSLTYLINYETGNLSSDQASIQNY